ncbi:MAG: TIGR02449 family protein [Gammaproteobacteria bacterium]|nr:TIGR02449 family protein [Gammaproteobacteria bacterium]MBT8149856.1 TIGR02449 family protein [Gammaproteobacteria bacterium]NND38690.1 TIGR02449 family protein [Pseudomonadales bacterium]NNL10901.1 TIGR02449 family protein [Pseudomonadales bacterium]NNM11596.1 TIGR02449 family protein [Pseudomonadales bacterium]
MRDRLENLEEKVDELVALCTALDKENKNLRGRETEWQTERRKLLIKNESARNKVEAMISRLKSMESGE